MGNDRDSKTELKSGKPKSGVGVASLGPPPSDDNWKHRSKGMLCGSCMFFKEKVTTKVQRADHVIGRCREDSPTLQGWPVIWSDDWCGSHKLDETKI